jgi:hypothetical protein
MQRAFILLFANLACLSLASCKPAQSPQSDVSQPVVTKSPFQCGAQNYVAFENLPVLSSMNDLVPRKQQTAAQRNKLEAGTAAWQLPVKPVVTCTASNHLQLSYKQAQNSVVLTIAPAGALLDPLAHTRMLAMASALEEALVTLRTKSCSDSGKPCTLTRNPDPLAFPGSALAYSVQTEFPAIGQRAWQSVSMKDGVDDRRTVYTSTDGKFDVAVEVRITKVPEADDGALHLVSEYLSKAYDERR